MKTLLRIFALLMPAFYCSAQAVLPPNIRAANTIDALTDTDRMGLQDMVYGIPMEPGKVIGDTYLDPHWKMATILLYEKEQLIKNYPVRYDIRLDEVEVKARDGVKVLKGTKIKSFVWMDSVSRVRSYFINAKDFNNESNVPYTGFFQVLVDGPLPLLKKTLIEIKKADYNIQMNVGSHDDKILKKTEYYTLIDNLVVDLPSGKKKLIAMFPDKVEAVEKFIKDSDLTVSREDHLALIFTHYNSLGNN